jgi:hypothetical protein
LEKDLAVPIPLRISRPGDDEERQEESQESRCMKYFEGDAGRAQEGFEEHGNAEK